MPKKSQPQQQVRSLLIDSLNAAHPVRIRRKVERHEVMDGVVLDLNDDWVLIASIRDRGFLDGYRVFKLADLRRVEPATAFEEFLRHGAEWPPASPMPSLNLASPRSIIETAAKTGTIVTLFREAKRPGTCLIGAPTDWGKKSVWLLTIDPEANWESFVTKIPLKDITQISFAGDYEKALLYAAGDRPARMESR